MITGPRFSIKDVTTSFSGKVSNLTFDQKKEFVYLDFNESFKSGSAYSLRIKFEIIIRNNGFGMYSAPYIDNNGDTK